MNNIFRTYFLPGLIMQSVVIGGGYGTGREISEFLLSQGPFGGLFALLTATILWSATLAISFELARLAGTYEYKTFIQNLLGPGWVVFELVYLTGAVLVLSVVAAASGELLHNMTGAPKTAGIVFAMLGVSFITYMGSGFIKKLFVTWSLLIYVAYGILIYLSLNQFGENISAVITPTQFDPNWVLSGAKYAALNLGVIPAVLFCVQHLKSKQETLISGSLSGPIIMIPALLLFLSLLTQYPDILQEPIPTSKLLETFNLPVFSFFFQLLLLGTIIDTGAAFVHGVNVRLSHSFETKNEPFTGLHRICISIFIFSVAAFAAERVGLIALVSRGFGIFAFVSIAVFLAPVLTIGLWRVIKSARTGP